MEHSSTPMVTNTLENGKLVKRMDKVLIIKEMGRSMRESGLTANNTAKVPKLQNQAKKRRDNGKMVIILNEVIF